MKYKIILLLLIVALQGCAAKSDRNIEPNHSENLSSLPALKVVKKQFRFISSCQPFTIYENDKDLFVTGYSNLLGGVRLFGISNNIGEQDGVTTTIDAINFIGAVPAILVLGILDPSGVKKAFFSDYEIDKKDGIVFTDKLMSTMKLTKVSDFKKCNETRKNYKAAAPRSAQIFSVVDGSDPLLHIKVENYREILKAYNDAIAKYDSSILDKGEYPDIAMLINKSTLTDAVKNAASKKQMLAVKKITSHIGYAAVNDKIKKKITWLDFNSAFNTAKRSSIGVKRQFVKRYASYSRGKHKVKLINTAIFNEVRESILRSSNITEVTSYYNQHKSDAAVKTRLTNLYRQKNTFPGFIKAYDISGLQKDIKSAYLVAITVDEKTIVEAKLLKTLNPNKFVKIDVLRSSESALREASSSSLVHSYRGMVRDYNRTIKVSFDPKSGMPVKYGRYKVNVEMKLNLDYSIPINGKNKDFDSKSIAVLLTPENNYSATLNLSYEAIAVHGKYHLLAATMLTGLANMFGANMNSSDMDIAIDLNDTKLTSSITSVVQN